MRPNNKLASTITFFLAGLGSAMSHSAWANDHLFLELVVNSTAKNSVIEIKATEQAWYAKREELASLGFSWILPDREWVSLDELPDSSWKYYAVTQRLHLRVAPKFLPLQDLRTPRVEREPATRDSGGFLNYSIVHNHSEIVGESTSVWHSVNAFTSNTFWSTSGIYRHMPDGSDDYIRFDTRLLLEFENPRIGVQLGDVFNHGRQYLPSYRVGGIRIARDFSLDPERAYYPIPQFLGEAEIPSSLEVYLNDQRVQAMGIESGPYQLSLDQTSAGFNSATIVTQDIQGRPVTQQVDFYVATNLLRKGLVDFDISAGKLRNHYGIRNADYSNSLLSTGRITYGLTNYLTTEIFGQHYENRSNLGGGVALRLGNFGALSATLGQSHTNDVADGAELVHYNYDYYRYGFGFYINHLERDVHYADLVESQYSNFLKSQSSVGISKSSEKYGQFNFSYIDKRYWKEPAAPSHLPVFDPTVPMLPSLGNIRITQASWHKTLDRDLTLTARWQKFAPLDSHSFSLGLTYFFGERSAASVQTQRHDDFTSTYASVTRNTPYPYGVGWSLSASDSHNNPRYADVRLRHKYGNGIVRYIQNNYDRMTSAEWSGSIVVMDQELYLSPSIYDAFAIVDTGRTGVPVYSGFQDFGISNKHGRQIIPDLSGYLTNTIRIDPLTLPENTLIPNFEKHVRPKRNGGIYVNFDVQTVTQVLTRAISSDNKPLPAGTTLYDVNGNSVFVGWDGELFIANAFSHQYWDWPDGKCRLILPELHIDETNQLPPIVCNPYDKASQ